MVCPLRRSTGPGQSSQRVSVEIQRGSALSHQRGWEPYAQTFPSPVESEVAHEEEKREGTSERKRVETLGRAVEKAQDSVGSRVDDWREAG